MSLLKILFIIVTMILAISSGVLAVVYDDEGVITEEEISKEMKEIHKMGYHPGQEWVKGGCMSGCIMGLVWWVVISRSSDSFSEENFGVAVIGGVLLPFVGYELGSKLGSTADRRAAIERIKEKHKIDKQKDNNKSLGADTRIILPLLTGKF